MIHVCFALNDASGRYAKFVGTAMLSIFDNTSAPVTVHILHDDTLTPDNREKFLRVAQNRNVEFHNVESLCAARLNEIRNALPETFAAQYSAAAMYRFLLPQIVPTPLNKIIYLDADVIVNLDLEELWRLELGDKPLAAVPVFKQNLDTQTGLRRAKRMFSLCNDGFVRAEHYFNSGVLLMNLTAFRSEEELVTRGLEFVARHRYKFFDQDALNYCFAERAEPLPLKFNRGVRYERLEGEGVVASKIYHYVGQNPSWSFGLDMRDAFNRLWMSCFMRTPWFDVESIGRLFEGVQRLHVGLKNAMANLTAIVSGKARAFVALPEDVAAVREVFGVKASEEILLVESSATLPKLLNTMKRARGRVVFFIMVSGFPFDALTAEGFVQNRDFLDGFDFLSEAQGVPLDSHALVKAM